MQRREFAKTVGGIAGASALGGAALVAGTGGASASAGQDIPDPDVAVSDDGRIKWVAVQTTGRLTWDGFDEAAKYGRVITEVELWQDGETVFTGQINDTDLFDLAQDGWGGAGEETVLGGDNEPGQSGHIASDVDWGIAQRNRDNIYDNSQDENYGLPQNPAPTNRFTAHDDGSQRATRVVLRSEYRLYDVDENELTGKSGYPDRPVAESDFVVTVENQQATTGFESKDAENETTSNSTVGV